MHLTSRTELSHLLISWLTISLAFAWVTSSILNLADFVAVLPTTLVAVATGFILHELAHKYVAIFFKAHAEYRMWVNGLVLAVVLALFVRVVFAAPGATYVYGSHITHKQNALISIAGPLVNLAVAGLFFALFLTNTWANLSLTVAYVNLFLATFNLIPIRPLDGSKVMSWKPVVWAAIFIPSLIFTAMFWFA